MSKPGSTATDLQTLRIFWQASLKHRRLFALSLLHTFGWILLATVVPLFTGKILAAIGNPAESASQYIPYFIAAATIAILANRYGFATLLTYQAKVMSDLQSKSLEVLLRRSVGFHNNHIGGKLVSDAIDYPTAFGLLSNAAFINLLPFSFTLVVGTILVFSESTMLGFVILAMAAYALGSGIYDSRQRTGVRLKRLKATKDVTGHLADTILNVQTVKTFAREDSEMKANNMLNQRLLSLRLRDWRHAAYSGNNRIIILTVLQLIFILITIRLVESNPALLGIGIFAFTFTVTMTHRLFEVNAMVRNIEDGLLQAAPLTKIILDTPEVLDRDNAKPLQVTKGAINLTDATFRYNDSGNDDHVFSSLNLRVKSGQKIGLVGPSGGGKSTLTRLLLRFEDIGDGSITIDNQNIAKVTQASLRQAIAYVPQEPLLFHRSIRENISYGQPEASQDAVEEAAHKAHAHEFITALPSGYDTIVGERGVKLSGGQRQRIAIARAILKNAPILLLDEATSALDSESERLIQAALQQLMKGRTALVIAHRLSTIQRMDRIIVMDEGKIVDEGSHTDLLTHKGLYAKLWAHQSGGFLEE